MTMLRDPSGAPPGKALDDVDIGRDRELVTRAQAGDRAAFEHLYELYRNRLWRFCLKRLQDPDEAEDVTQEAFVHAWRALPGFSGERRFYPWLSVIAAHLCVNVVRKRNRSDRLAEFHGRVPASWEGYGEDHVLADHEHRSAAVAFDRLSDRHRLILSLREHRGWSYKEIADHQGVRVSTIESLLWRAREALKREYTALTGEGAIGAGGVLAFSLRRWYRGTQAVVQQGGGLVPNSPPLVVGPVGAVTSALAAAATTLAAVAAVVLPPTPTVAPSSNPPTAEAARAVVSTLWPAVRSGTSSDSIVAAGTERADTPWPGATRPVPQPALAAAGGTPPAPPDPAPVGPAPTPVATSNLAAEAPSTPSTPSAGTITPRPTQSLLSVPATPVVNMPPGVSNVMGDPSSTIVASGAG